MWAQASLFRRFTDKNAYGIRFRWNMENSPQNIRGYTEAGSKGKVKRIEKNDQLFVEKMM